MSVELHQLESQVEVIGTLKELDIKPKVSAAGNNYIGGDIVVEVKEKDKIHNIKISVLVMQTSKLFKGIQTVYNEFVDEARSRQSGQPQDRVQIIGNMEMNEWANDQGVITNNLIRGVFYNRINDKPELTDRAIARIEGIVEGYEDKVDQDNLPTGEKSVKLLTVGYGPKVHEITNVFVSQSLAKDFSSLYFPGSTGKLTLKINSYVLVPDATAEANKEETVSHGFGSQVDVTPSTITRTDRSLEIIGGDLPSQEPRGYSQAQLEEVRRIRRLDLAKLEDQEPTQPQAQTKTSGFGTGGTFGNNDPFAAGNATTEISDDDLPF